MKEFIEKLIGRLEEIKNAKVIKEDGKPYGRMTQLWRVFGINEAIKIVNQLAEEYKEINIPTIDAGELLGNSEQVNDFCEWKKENSNKYVCNAHAEIHDSRVLDWCVCPYCGKKIKIAPYQPKGE